MIGFGTVMFLGPVFFTLLRNSIEKNVRAGISTAVGIIVSDIVVAAICYYFAADFIADYVNAPIVKFAAAIIFFGFGYSFIFKPLATLQLSDQKVKTTEYFKFFAQGFAVNFVNPTVFVLWIGFIALGQTQYTSQTDLFIYLSGILLGIFSTDLAKAFGANYLSPYLKSHWLKYLFSGLGIVFLVMGGIMVYKGISQLI